MSHHADDGGEALDGFVAKWSAVRPELGLAARFLAPRRDPAPLAFACLAHELGDAAFRIREAQVAGAKLHWWAEELARSTAGHARHPLTHALAAAGTAPVALWHDAIAGALIQRDADSAGDVDRLLDGYAALYAPLARAEAALFDGLDAQAGAEAMALSRALSELGALGDALAQGRLPLPLDVLARHGLARGDLGAASPARADAMRDLLGELARRLRSVLDARPALSLPRVAELCADHARARRAARAADPLAALVAEARRLPLATLWSLWRAARAAARP